MKCKVVDSHGSLTSRRVEDPVPLLRGQFACNVVQSFILQHLHLQCSQHLFCQQLTKLTAKLSQNCCSKRCQSLVKCLLASQVVHPSILVDIGAFCEFLQQNLFWPLFLKHAIKYRPICYFLSISLKLPHLSPREKMHPPKIARAKLSHFSDTFQQDLLGLSTISIFKFV